MDRFWSDVVNELYSSNSHELINIDVKLWTKCYTDFEVLEVKRSNAITSLDSSNRQQPAVRTDGRTTGKHDCLRLLLLAGATDGLNRAVCDAMYTDKLSDKCGRPGWHTDAAGVGDVMDVVVDVGDTRTPARPAAAAGHSVTLLAACRSAHPAASLNLLRYAASVSRLSAARPCFFPPQTTLSSSLPI